MITEEKIMQDIAWLSAYGKNEEQGITRVLYSKSWKDAQEAIRQRMNEQGFISEYDDVGNLFITLEGSEEKERIILCGSHIDTVANGGNLDGQYGIIGGLLALQMLRETYGLPKKTLQIVSIAEEEGSRFPFAFWGSKNIVGAVKKEKVHHLTDCNGIPFPQAMAESGFCYKQLNVKKEIDTFLELHIEQGAVLEREQFSIGIVESIVGQKRFEITIIGQANHAGTTPMFYRQDSLHCSAKIICKIMEEAELIGNTMVATVGKIELSPNTPNVIPGKTCFTLDVRHDSKEILNRFDSRLRKNVKEIATSMSMESTVFCYEQTCPAYMNSNLIKKIERSCIKRQVTYRKMASGAGHDAQIFASNKIPSAMIFVPSVGGISHNKEESTKPENLVQGVEILADVLRDLAY